MHVTSRPMRTSMQLSKQPEFLFLFLFLFYFYFFKIENNFSSKQINQQPTNNLKS